MKLKELHGYLSQYQNSSLPVTWGMPWKRGDINAIDMVEFKNSNGKSIPIQTWPLAYWPDGSIKWTGHASEISPCLNTEQLVIQKASEKTIIKSNGSINIEEKLNYFLLQTKKLKLIIYKNGTTLWERYCCKTNQVKNNMKLVVVVEKTEEELDHKNIKHKEYIASLNHVTIEQAGPIRAVIKFEGNHVVEENEQSGIKRTALPFILRMYIYLHSSDIRFTHTFIYDGEPALDINSEKIRAIGAKTQFHLTGHPYNRHISWRTENGWYTEASQLLLSRRYSDQSEAYQQQIKGKSWKKDEIEVKLLEQARKNTIWQNYLLLQESANHYNVRKSVDSRFSSLDVYHGERSNGSVYVRGVDGGLQLTTKDFWQKYPSSIEINQIAAETSHLTYWIWSKETEGMDFRHYSDQTYVESAYEGFEDLAATPIGIANTNEWTLHFADSKIDEEELNKNCEQTQNRPLLICEANHYYESKACGVWGLRLHRTSMEKFLEAQLSNAISFYMEEINQRNWYGLWNYGDWMHSYDTARHQWRYDLGGFAWQNSELVPNLWLWYSFFRTVDKDVFHLAEAMTRHTSEVDQYHAGDFAGLGSRHNVSHWGCGCKEARVSMAHLHKYYHFLTADERVGDIIAEVQDVDEKMVIMDPMREFYRDNTFDAHVRVAPDWTSFVSNWIHMWEKTNNSKYHNRINVGLNTIKNAPLRLLSGPDYGYDVKSKALTHIGDGTPGGYHMVIAFGAPQVWFELAELTNDDILKQMIAEFGAFYFKTNNEKISISAGKLDNSLFDWPMFATGIGGYAANYLQDKKLKHKIWQTLFTQNESSIPLPIKIEKKSTVFGEINEITNISTNALSQWCLNVITCLEWIRDELENVVVQESDKEEKK